VDVRLANLRVTRLSTQCKPLAPPGIPTIRQTLRRRAI
jgi:hypothetical protein